MIFPGANLILMTQLETFDEVRRCRSNYLPTVDKIYTLAILGSKSEEEACLRFYFRDVSSLL